MISLRLDGLPKTSSSSNSLRFIALYSSQSTFAFIISCDPPHNQIFGGGHGGAFYSPIH